MLYRIKYEDKYKQEKTLVYDAERLSEVLTFANKLGKVLSVDALNNEGNFVAATITDIGDWGDD